MLIDPASVAGVVSAECDARYVRELSQEANDESPDERHPRGDGTRQKSRDNDMRPLSAALITTLTLVFSTGAQSVPDHLKCYKVRDPQARATYTADLDGLAAEPGCTIKVPAIVACVPATKTNVRPAPPGGGGTGMPNAFGCYKIKCPKAMLSAIPLNDQFGTRSVTPSTAKILCAPAVPTTTTTTIPCSVPTGLGRPCQQSSECCPVPHGSVFCGGNPTVCRLGVCDPGYQNCNLTAADGCEVNLNTDPSNCGSCGRVCPTGLSCVMGSCR